MKRILMSLLVLLAIDYDVLAGDKPIIAVADVEALPGETVSFAVNMVDGKADTYTAMTLYAYFPTEGFATTETYSVSSSWVGAMGVVGDINPTTGLAKIPFASADAITGSEVNNLVTVSFTVDNSVAVGEYPVTLKGTMFEYNSSDKDYADDVTFNIKVVNVHTVVLDETSTVAPTAANDVNVIVKRTIKAGNWSTICLPFAMTEEQVKTAFGNDVELADFTGYDIEEDGEDIVGITVNFDNATEIEANHPYIIKVSAPMTEFTVDGVDIDPEDVPCVSFGFTTGKGSKAVYHPIDFNGTYVADFDFYNDAVQRALFISDNKFYYATENTKHMKAFRGYFDFDDLITETESSSARISMFFNGEITDINKVSEKKSDKSGVIYDLQGRRVNKPIKGIFIMDGKKVVVKH